MVPVGTPLLSVTGIVIVATRSDGPDDGEAANEPRVNAVWLGDILVGRAFLGPPFAVQPKDA